MINNLRGTFLSNFYDCRVIYEGIWYRNAESAYQASKLDSRKARLQFQGLTGAQAKALGRTVELRDDWEDVKLSNMYDVVSAKFANNTGLRMKLMMTGDEEIVEENTWGDTYWGVCQGKGENHLGKILMFTRWELTGK
jgi:ribA/ribD-fused uncharacterized protein